MVLALIVGVGVALGTGAGGANAQVSRTTELRGKVTAEEGGVALAGATVELVGTGRRVVTDDVGSFRFRDLAVGTYTLRISLIGRAVLERRVRVEGDGVDERVVLDVDPVGLEPVLVLMERTRLMGSDRSRAELAGSGHVIGPQTLEQRKLLFGDVHAILREVPGVHMQEEEGYGLRPNIGMRGTGSDRSSKITVMEDGVLIAPAPYAAPAAYYFPVAARMESIEVRKGSSQIRYGPQTIGGALNLISSSIPSSLTVLADASGGTATSYRLRGRVGDSSERFGWMVETVQLGTDGFKQLDGGGETGFALQDYVAKVRVNTPLKTARYHELELKLGYYDQRSDETYLGLTDADFRVSPLRRYAASREDVMNAEHYQARLRHFARPLPTVDVTTTLYYNDFARLWYKLQSVAGASLGAVLEDPAGRAGELAILRGGDSEDDALAVRANNREYWSRGIQTAVGTRFRLGVPHQLEVGARYHEDAEDRFQHDDRYAMRSGLMVLTTPGQPGSQANRVSEAAAWSLYAEDRLRLGALTLTPGLRYESIDFVRLDYAAGDAERNTPSNTRENGVNVWIPGLGISYDVVPGATVFGGVHRGFAPPGPGANADTEPEFSTNYELGTRLRRPTFSGQAAVFYSDYTNVLGAETLSSGTDGTGDIFNGGAVAAWGLELVADHDVLANSASGWRLPLHGAYTFTRATFRNAFESDYEPWGNVVPGDELPYIPAHQLFVRGGAESGAWAARLTASYTSPMRTVAGQGAIPDEQSTDGALVLGASAEYHLHPSMMMHVGVENLTDAHYAVARRPAGLRPGLPRSIQLGLRVSR
jgi:Fe(3+) dicitrate transport protein